MSGFVPGPDTSEVCKSEERKHILKGLRYDSPAQIRELEQRRGRRQRERQKSNRFRLAKTTLHVDHAFFLHFFAVVARLQRKTS